ncbi:hypothetical protein A0H81_11097 [Grifola frondosa]|uniref:Uncharacterized protein n=1 Tax=Grifola frondosa TaxID=5627 RepID=A0A1C7LXK9_GRIFR|nr:hypothetical protein A0H81_11097 [Grifola frondosa]
MTTQPPQSLPSFAQAFSAPSLSRISNASNALPPIHNNRSPPFDHDRRSPSVHDSPQTSNMEPRQNTRKRIHAESSMQGNDNSSESDGRRSPRIVRIKEEADYDTLPSSQPKSALQPQDAQHITDPPQPSASKRRRVTISGISHPINTDVTAPSSDPNKSISPVVMGFTIGRDDPAALEQRRGSTAGIVSTATPSVNVVNAPPPVTTVKRRLKFIPRDERAGAAQTCL